MSKKILIVRFSSIGDIVLTTPVLRCLKQQMKDLELHYVTKKIFSSVLENNPFIDKLHVFEKDVVEIVTALRQENFDLVIDLHHNLRSMRLKNKLVKESRAYNKLNLKKFLAVNFKKIGILPKIHIVDRYFETVKDLGVNNDGRGLDHFISANDEFDIQKKFPQLVSPEFIALVVGGSYYTKKIPLAKLEEICNSTSKQFILLGSKDDAAVAEQLAGKCTNVINACGQLTLNQSAFVVKQAQSVVTSDTGLMHIAAAYKKKIFSFWGNTIPEFGMYAYLPDTESKLMEVKGLGCRPCSKLGYSACPKGHFKCMMDINVSDLKL